MSKNDFACVILAAGRGTRLKSDLPKALHKVAGFAMVNHVIRTAQSLNPSKIVCVVAPDMDNVRQAVAPVTCAVQQTANGTAGAALAAKEALKGFEGDVLILYCDTPLITAETMQALLKKRREKPETGLVFSAMRPDDPGRYGRMVLNNDGSLDRIVEFADATDEEKKIGLCNGGIVCADGRRLFQWLEKIGNDNAQGEYYLTDLPTVARADNMATQIAEIPCLEMEGVNSRADLSLVEAYAQNRLRQQAMDNGATLQDPATTFFSLDTKLGRDVVIGANVVFGPGVTVEDEAEILPFTHIEGTHVGRGAKVGPFARLRPGTRIGPDAKIGNFVETKKTDVAAGAKIPHLSYIGDASVGEKSNIGAGTITCNYDGFFKYRTEIGKDVFIGSNTALVAPIKIGDGAIVGAGSTLTEDVGPQSLTFNRAPAVIKESWAKKFREEMKKKKEEKS